LTTSSSDEKRLAKHRRYNASVKGQRRNARYEAKHPERKVRWSPITGREVAKIPMPEVLPNGPMP
jgi:hypothetical protein